MCDKHPTRLASIVAAFAVIASVACQRGNELRTPASASIAATVVVQSVSVIGSAPAVGGTSQLTAGANLSDGSTRDVTPQATWFSSNQAAVTVSATGMATGVSAGQTIVQATYQGLTGVLPMNVVIALPPPANLADVFVCDKRGDDASDINRTLYIPKYPSSALSQIDLGFTSRDTPRSDLPAPYTVQLSVIVNGGTAGTKTASVIVGSAGQRAQATFTFSPPLAITPGSAVRLVAERISGPGELSYEGQADSSCPVLVTADRKGETQIIGPKIPVHVVGAPR